MIILGLSNMLNTFNVTSHFKLSEFECPCCKRVMLDARLLAFLDAVRKVYGKPIRITSGYRCACHNVRVWGALMSKHTVGAAADIATTDDEIHNAISRVFLEGDFGDEIEVKGERDHIHVEVK